MYMIRKHKFHVFSFDQNDLPLADHFDQRKIREIYAWLFYIDSIRHKKLSTYQEAACAPTIIATTAIEITKSTDKTMHGRDTR